MNRELLYRTAGEFGVIVVGVLVALGVDDWSQARDDRRLEAQLLARLESELLADAADLELARREVKARRWVFDAVLAELGDESAMARLLPARLDSLQNPTRLDSLRVAAGREGTWAFEPERLPLGPAFRLWPEFDYSDDVYTEMLATGSLRIVSETNLRAAMVRYYRRAEDQAGNERRAGDYQARLEGALLRLGLSPGDSITLDEFVSAAREQPAVGVELRQMQHRMRAQLFYYELIDEAREEFERELATNRNSGR